MLQIVTFLFLCILDWEFVDSQVCTKKTQYMKSFTMPNTVMVVESYHTKCWYSNRCRRTRRVPHTTYVNSHRVETKIIFSCCNGYTMDETKSQEDSIVCNPVCIPACTNGYCVSPGKCTCNDGYINYGDTNYDCIPVCDNGCEHGQCKAPNTCTCDFGYNLKNGSCTPICTEPCLDGTCIAPESCECNPGYRKNSDNRCTAYCSLGCMNGNCITPEVCACNQGYIYQNGACIPECANCDHGTCTAPNFCECFEGYVKTSPNNTCQPYCTKACEHGTCAAPEVCQCDDGYALKNGSCEPECKQTCVNSSCTQPDTCQCWAGYEKQDNFTCKLNCSQDCNLGNGVCTVPDGCECRDQYQKLNDQCTPICFDCGNGICIEPGVCKCYPGYNLKIIDFYEKCVPVCNNCNGTCEAPGLCTCEYPYVAVNVTSDGKDCDINQDCNIYDIKHEQTICVLETETSKSYFSVTTSTSYTEVAEGNTGYNETEEYEKTYTSTENTYEMTTEFTENYRDEVISEKSVLPYWIYITICCSLMFILALVIIIFVKRKYVIQFFKGGSYTIEDAKNEKLSSSENNEMRLSTLLKKNKEDV